MSAEREHSGGGRTLTRHWRALLIVAGYGVLLTFCAVAIHTILRDTGGFRQFLASLRSLGLPVVLHAALCVAGTYAIMCAIEQMVLRDVEARLPLASTIAAPLIANSVSIGVGFGAVSGAAIRFRVYGRYGMDAQTCVLVASGVTLISLSGGAVMAAIGMTVQPEAIASRIGISADILRTIGIAVLTGTIALLVAAGGKSKPLKILGRRIKTPSARAAILRLTAGAVDWLISATVLFLLLPHGAQTHWLAFAAFFASLHFIAMSTGAPAGIGVFDAAMLGLNPTEASSGQLAAALVVYRLLGFLLPLAAGTTGLLFLEGRRRLRPHHVLPISGDEPTRARLFAQRMARRLVHFAGAHFFAFNTPTLSAGRPARRAPANIGALMQAAVKAPRTSVRTLTRGGPILVLAPHPDDEVLGCGGLLAACAASGIKAHVAILTDGSLSHPGSIAWSPRRLAARRAIEARKAAGVLGVTRHRLRQMNLDDGRLLFDRPAMTRATEDLARLVRQLNVKCLFVSWRHDPHPDHIAAAMLAERLRLRMPYLRVLEYPIWGRMLPKDVTIADGPWLPHRLDISPWLIAKRRALLAYRTQTTGLIADSPLALRLQLDQLDALLTRNEIFFSAR